ncbi:MAG TPA: DUF1361 domain-containing protein [Candidatus Saccharibacteria bacterium]|nr:DUF1361 domain-containing protein [Candidatus Saccharibacteria bacterium]
MIASKNHSVKRDALTLSLICIVVFIMAGLRAAYSGTLTNLFVYWNIFLALAAFGFIKLFNKLGGVELKPKLKNLSLVFVFMGWLSLMPNAIYLVTDVGHLNSPKIYQGSRIKTDKLNSYQGKREIPYLYDVVMLFLLALVGFQSSGMLTTSMFKALKNSQLKKYIKFNRKSEFLFLGLVSLATGVAIFLGRYLRWNSWDVIINPINILKDLYYYFTHPLATPSLYLSLVLFFVLTVLAHVVMKTKAD